MEEPLPYTHGCYVCGRDNPLGFRLRVYRDGDEVRARFRPEATHGGFARVVHGGITATLLDEVMVWAASIATRRFCFTARSSVRYLRPWPVGIEGLLTARAEKEGPETARARRTIAFGTVTDPAGVVLARAEGVFLPVPDDQVDAFTEDFVDDPATCPVAELVPRSFPVDPPHEPPSTD